MGQKDHFSNAAHGTARNFFLDFLTRVSLVDGTHNLMAEIGADIGLS